MQKWKKRNIKWYKSIAICKTFHGFSPNVCILNSLMFDVSQKAILCIIRNYVTVQKNQGQIVNKQLKSSINTKGIDQLETGSP